MVLGAWVFFVLNGIDSVATCFHHQDVAEQHSALGRQDGGRHWEECLSVAGDGIILNVQGECRDNGGKTVEGRETPVACWYTRTCW